MASNHKLTIEFPTEEAKQKFAEWLCNSGEQDYMRVMEESKTPSLRLGYHGIENTKYPHDDKRRYGKFLCDNTIRVEVVPE